MTGSAVDSFSILLYEDRPFESSVMEVTELRRHEELPLSRHLLGLFLPASNHWLSLDSPIGQGSSCDASGPWAP